MSLFEKLKSFIGSRSEEVVESSEYVDDWDTRDKSLRALRRLRRRQLDEVERKQLLKDISNYNSDREKSYFRDSSLLKGDRLKKSVGKQKLFSDTCGFVKKSKKKSGFL